MVNKSFSVLLKASPPIYESSWKVFQDQSRVCPLSEWQHGCHYQEIDGELASASSSSKNDAERAVASFPQTSPAKITVSQHQLPNNNPTPHQGHESAVAASARHLIVILNELLSSKFDGERVLLCPPQCLPYESNGKGFHDQARVHPLIECQHQGCHYQAWLFQARNHVCWRRLV